MITFVVALAVSVLVVALVVVLVVVAAVFPQPSSLSSLSLPSLPPLPSFSSQALSSLPFHGAVEVALWVPEPEPARSRVLSVKTQKG